MEITIISIVLGSLLAIIGYFLKRVMDNTDKIAEDVSDMKPKVKILWEDKFSSAHSPRQLNQRGLDILNTSGIKEIVNAQKAKLTNLVKDQSPNNPYDAEKVIMSVLSELPEHCPEVIPQLKSGSFESGVTVDVLLYVGGLYLRNEIFPEIGFSLEDLDKPHQ